MRRDRDRTTITIVGAGSPTPSAERFGASVVVEHAGQLLMIDCGPGATAKMLQSDLKPQDVSSLLITHHHFDHTADAAALMMTRWESTYGLQVPLQVVGPPATRRFIEALVGPQGAFRPDIVARREHPLSLSKYRLLGGKLPRPDLEVLVTELVPGESVRLLDQWDVATTQGRHVQPYHESLAYRVQVGGSSIVVTGDTELWPGLEELAAGADVLIAMCVLTEKRFRDRDMSLDGQMATEAVGRLARRAAVGTVILTHTKPEMAEPRNRERAVREVGARFDGEVVFAVEGLRLDV